MMAFVYVLALLFFTFTNGQVTSWTGAGQNDTSTNADNWSNGVPGPDSTVYINATSCGGSCDVTFDADIVIGTLIIDSTSTVYIRIVGKNVTIANGLTIGNPTTSSSIYIVFTEGGIFEIGADAQATIYYTNSNPIYPNDDAENWFVNKGTVTFLGVAGTTTYSEINIGSSSYNLKINSWGNWIANDGLIFVQFYYTTVNIYGGLFEGTILNTDTDPSIDFYYTDVVLQDGSSDNFYWVSFTSRNPQTSQTTFSDPAPNVLIFNSTADQTVSNATFYGTNIVAWKNIWLTNVNLTYYAMVNITNNDVIVYFNGENNNFEDAILIGLGTNGIFQVEETAQVTMTDYFSIYGTITLINKGVWIFDSSSYLYFDVNAFWVNLGRTTVIRASNDFIWGSQFPGLSTRTSAGTMVNMGTIEFINGGGLNFQDGTGTFYQCKNGILKFAYGYPAAGNTPGTVTFPENIALDGYVGISYEDDSSTASTLFYWKENADATIFDGSVDLITKGDGDKLITPFLCFDPTTGYVQIYDLLYDNSLACPNDDQTQFLGGLPGADVCADLPDEIQALQDEATCPASANCGIDTGSPAGGNGGDTSDAHVNVACLAFLVSLVCLLLKF